MFKKRRILRRCPGIAAGAGAASAMSASSKAGAASASGLERVRNGPSVCGSFAATWARIMSRMVRIGTRGARETFLDGGKGESPRAAQNSLNATSPIKRPRVRQDETHIIVQGTRHVLSRRPCIYTGGKIEDAKDFCLNRLAVFRRGRAGPARAGLPRGVDRAVKEVSGLPPARGACWQARVLIKTWAARPARHRRARRGPRGRVARPSARR